MNRLLLIDDEADVQYSFKRIFGAPDVEIFTADSGEEGLRLIPRVKPDLVLMDIRMGGISGLETLRRLRQSDAKLPVIIMTAYGTTQAAIEAMKLGAYDYLLKPFDLPKLKETVASALKAARDMKQVVSFQSRIEPEDDAVGVIGRSEPMQAVFKTIGQVAASDATVLITGESGTGKELVARAIYHHSRRSDRPFIAINCAAIPENLLESELFGHERGAFTGAVTQRIGKFEQCNGGTLFLDEIGEMSPTTQTKILRVLQSGTFDRVGGSNPIQADVRILAATNRNLEGAVADKLFREDLYYRLNVVRIHLPALRQRKEDIPLLVSYFLGVLGRRTSRPTKSISTDALALLQTYSWPGNVRELENAIHRAVVMAKGEVILPGDLPPEIGGSGPESPPTPKPLPESQGSSPEQETSDLQKVAGLLFAWARKDSGLRVLPSIERELIIHALAETHGNQVKAAQLLGITRATLRKRIEKFRIRKELSIR